MLLLAGDFCCFRSIVSCSSFKGSGLRVTRGTGGFAKGSLCFVSLVDAAVNVSGTLEVESGFGIAECIVDG